MLSFMREQEREDSSAQKPQAAHKIAADSSGVPDEQEYLTVAGKSKNVRKTTYLLAALFGLGLLGLLFMIKKIAPQTAKAADSGTAETKIEMAIARLTGIKSEMFSRMDEIVTKFYEFSSVPQIRVNELVKNPFEHDELASHLPAILNIEKEDSDPDPDLLREQRIKQQASQLQLLSIMQWAQGNCCMINERILYEGDSIKGFRVRQIGNSFVRLEWDPDSIMQNGHQVGSDSKADKEYSRIHTIILTLSQ